MDLFGKAQDGWRNDNFERVLGSDFHVHIMLCLPVIYIYNYYIYIYNYIHMHIYIQLLYIYIYNYIHMHIYKHDISLGEISSLLPLRSISRPSAGCPALWASSRPAWAAVCAVNAVGPLGESLREALRELFNYWTLYGITIW